MNAGGVDKACKSCGRNYQLLASDYQQKCYNQVVAFRYRKFNVYQEAIELHRLIVRVTARFPKEFEYLRNQIRRAMLSVILNIAEGSAKSSDRDFNRYLGNSLGSIDETVAGCEVALNEKLITAEEFAEIERRALSISNQLGGFSKSLRGK